MKWWIKITLQSIAVSLSIGGAFAQDAEQYTSDILKDGTQIYAQNWAPPSPKGILVMITAYGATRGVLNKGALADIEVWKQDALSNHFGFSLINLVGDPKALSKGLGYFDVKSGSADLMRQTLDKTFPDNLPIFLYGRGDDAKRFVINVRDDSSQRIGGWCLYGGKYWTYAKETTTAVPGIVGTTTDSIRYDEIQRYFERGRAIYKPWLWVGFKAANEDQFKAFVRQYFYALANTEQQSERWVKIDSKESFDPTEESVPSANSAWLPNQAVQDLWSAIQTLRADQPTVVEEDVSLDKATTLVTRGDKTQKQILPDLHFYLRLPPGQKDASGVSGVIAYCTWVTDPKLLIQQLSLDAEQPLNMFKFTAVQMLRFASRHNLAVMTWSTPGQWNAGKSTDELTEEEKAQMDLEFNLYAEAWDEGVTRICTKYNLPKKDYLLYGMSRGAQWAHRLALRKPDRFLAVNIHVNSSYDEPTPEASKILWLVTTGEMEHGYAGGQRFYAECRRMGYPILFKAGENLGHATRADVEGLRDAFFDYALELKAARDGGQITDADFMNAFSPQNAKFIGDYLNQEVVPPQDAGLIEESKRVYLPTEALANAWDAPPPDN